MPERIDSFSDEAGNTVEPSRYGMKDWPAEALIGLTFEDHAGKTNFTLCHAVGAAPAADREACQTGWSESLDRQAGYLAKA